MNALRTLGGVLRSKLLGMPVPISMTLALTYRCNLRCRYCQIWKAAGPEMTTRQVLTAVDELAEAGMTRLGLTGGEPFLRPDIATIVDHAKGIGLFTTVFTNGTLVDKHRRTLRKLDAVLLSLDGDRPVHDAMRGKGAFDHAIRAMELLGKDGVPVWTNTVLTKRNIDSIDFVVDQARRFGAQAAFQPVFEHSYSVSGTRVQELRADEQKYQEVIDKLLRLKLAGAPLLNSRRFYEYVRNPSWQQNPRKCFAGVRYGAVSPEGNVAPCPVLLQASGLPSGLRVGFVEAFARSSRRIACKGCFCIATVESDLLLDLDPGAVANTLGKIFERGRDGRRRWAAETERASRVLPGPAGVMEYHHELGPEDGTCATLPLPEEPADEHEIIGDTSVADHGPVGA
jgi:MoaA/NifB/PqqE/SkfB family radical SAM enzyme